MKAKILIIGSTGKLGSKLLKYAYSNNIKIFAATCFNNKKKLLSQKLKYKIDNTFILTDQKERDNFLIPAFIEIFGFHFISFFIFEISAKELFGSPGLLAMNFFFPPKIPAIVFIEVRFPEPKL